MCRVLVLGFFLGRGCGILVFVIFIFERDSSTIALVMWLYPSIVKILQLMKYCILYCDK